MDKLKILKGARILVDTDTGKVYVESCGECLLTGGPATTT